jgi:AbrB family looped-hinge helix DNA binding protein
MNTTKLSSKGQVIIPKQLRALHQWEVGQELLIYDLGDGLLLKPKTSFAETDLDEAAACLPYPHKAKTLEEMDEAIQQGIQAQMANK